MIELDPEPRMDDVEGTPKLEHVALLMAAMDSPMALHRHPSLEVALGQALRGDVALEGHGPEALTQALELAQECSPGISRVEDWWPSDPRLVVKVAHAGQRWRLHPGHLVGPVDAVEIIVDVCMVIDAKCQLAHGFRASDLVELGLRYADAAVEHAAPQWPEGDRGVPAPGPHIQGEPPSASARLSARHRLP